MPGGVLLLAALALQVALVVVTLRPAVWSFVDEASFQIVYLASCGLVSVVALISVFWVLKDALAGRVSAAACYVLIPGGVVMAALAPWTFLLGFISG